jgi:hypothetical protein
VRLLWNVLSDDRTLSTTVQCSKITTNRGQRRVLEKLLLEAQAKLKKDEEDHQKNLSTNQTEPLRKAASKTVASLGDKKDHA